MRDAKLVLAFIFISFIGSMQAMGSVAASTTEARLVPPASGPIRVAFVLSPGATMIDFTGPWEVFQDVRVPGRGAGQAEFPFELYTVAETREPVEVTGGMRIVPRYGFSDAPQPHVIVVPAQAGSPGMSAWLRKASQRADLTMSVCTGAFQLAEAGLLDGRKATTHHDFFGQFARAYPKVDVQRGPRWVESRRIATAGGLTSGIDLALRVVARYFGDPVAERTSSYMEHTSTGWRADAGIWDPTTTEAAAREAQSRAHAPPPPALRGLDPVLLSEGRQQQGRADLLVERGRYLYAFADESTRARFLAAPESFEIQHDGACAAMVEAGAGPGSGDPDRYLVRHGRIYIFATDGCRESFTSRAP
jgi:putative intracellular protease/amidase